MGLCTITLYGANTDTGATGTVVNKSAVSALPTVTSQSFEVYGVWAQPDYKIETKEYLDGTSKDTCTVGIIYLPEIVPKDYPASGSITFDEYFLTTLMSKPCKWLDLGTYPIKPAAGFDSTKLHRVRITKFAVAKSSGGRKAFTIEMEGL